MQVQRKQRLKPYPRQTKIIELRERALWSQKDTAKKAGINIVTLSFIETGERKAQSGIKQKLFELFSMRFPDEVRTPDDLFLPSNCTGVQ